MKPYELKSKKAFDDLIAREDYLVTQANVLAKSFGNLSSLEHKVLDYLFSYVQPNDSQDKVYSLNIANLLKYLGRNASGRNYEQVLRAVKGVHKGTALSLPIEVNGTRGIRFTYLLDHVDVFEDGKINFRFSRDIAPYVFKLKQQFYSFRLRELSLVKSKYSLSLLKLWNAHTMGVWKDYNNPRSLPPAALISGTLEEWEQWMLGTDADGNTPHWPAGRFKQKALTVAINELSTLYPYVQISLETIMDGRKTAGYKVSFHPIHTQVPL